MPPSVKLDIRLPSPTLTDIDSAYQLAGGGGLYRFIVTVACCISMLTLTMFVYAVPLFLVKPPVECLSIQELWTPCSVHDVCSNSSVTYRISAPRDFNFITEFGMLCEDAEGTYIISAYFVGSLVSCLFVNALSDLWGRLPLLIFGNASNVLCIGALLLFPSFESSVIVAATIGMTTIAVNAPSYGYIYESFEQKHAVVNGTILNLMCGVCQALMSFIMWTGIKWRTLCIIIMGISASFFPLMIWLREAPRFYHAKGRPDLALVKLGHIAWINGRTLPLDLVFPPPPLIYSRSIKTMFRGLCCSRIMVIRLLLFTLCYSIGVLAYYAVSLNTQKMSGNVYFNGVMISLAVIVSSIIVGLLWGRFNKKISLVIYFGLGTAGNLMLGFFGDNIALAIVAIYISTSGSNSAVSATYLLTADIYPSSIRALAIGISVFFGRIICAFSNTLTLLDPMTMGIILAAACGGAAGISAVFPM